MAVSRGFEILEGLERKDRNDLVGNRMTSYGVCLGGGSIYYWSGKWKNNEDFMPEQMISIFSGTDCFLEILSDSCGDSMAQRYYHSWRPDRIESHYLSHDTVVVKEKKTIFHDTFVDRLQFGNQLEREVELILRLRVRLEHETVIEMNDEHVYLFSNKGRLAGVHRVIGFSGKCDFHQRQDVLIIDVPITLPANIGRHLNSIVVYMVVSMADTKLEAFGDYYFAKTNPEQCFVMSRQEWGEYFAQNVADFSCKDKLLEKMYYLANAMIKTNTYSFNKGFFRLSYTCPSKFRLLPQWFWDTAFHAIYEKWLTDTEVPRQSIVNILNAQDEKGHLPFIMDIDGSYLERVFPNTLMQPFILPIAVWDIYLKTGDAQFLRETLPGLTGFDRWVERERIGDGDLVFILQSGESGWDNSKRFLFGKESYVYSDAMSSIGRVYPVDVNTYMYLARHLIMKMAAAIGWKDLEEEYRIRRDKLKEPLMSMYNPSLGMYADILPEVGCSNVKSPAGMMPILTGLVDEKVVESIVEHLLNPNEFWSVYPIPTLSMDDPDYNDSDEYQSYWNGRVWPRPVNWIIIEGLFKNGYYGVARELCLKTMEMVTCLGEPNFCENYHSNKPYCYDITHDIFNYGWGGLVNDLLIRRLLGIQPNAPLNSIHIYPLFPLTWGEARLSNLHIGKHVVDIEYLTCGEDLRLRISHQGEEELAIVTELETKVVKEETIELIVKTMPGRTVHWVDM